MSRARGTRGVVLVGVGALLLLGGCVVRSAPQPVVPREGYVLQAAPVYPSQPGLVQQPPIVVYHPSPVAVRAPVRYYASGVPVGVYYQPRYVGGTYAMVCNPGSTRVCEAYCGSGYQQCSPDGGSWGPCIEGAGYPY